METSLIARKNPPRGICAQVTNLLARYFPKGKGQQRTQKPENNLGCPEDAGANDIEDMCTKNDRQAKISDH